MNLPDYEPSKDKKRWVSYFDLLGFVEFVQKHQLVEVFSETLYCLREQKINARLIGRVKCAWFSDTFLFYSPDDSRRSFQEIDHASRWFFDWLVEQQMPARGAMAFGDFYPDKVNNIFLGKALADAAKCGEKYNWLGFVLHRSALKQMIAVGQPCSKSYKQWKAEYKNRKTNKIETEKVVAYLIPDLNSLKTMASYTDHKRHGRKYKNAIQFVKHFATSNRSSRSPC